MCKYIDENGNCELTGIPCAKAKICTQETVYIDKQDDTNNLKRQNNENGKM